MPETAQRAQTPYDLVGGLETVQQVTARFYDLMESDPSYAALRAMHAADLSPMRESLAGFLTAWLGGPRGWFEARPGACMMSMHRRMVITQAAADQWAEAMRRAVIDGVPDAMIAAKLAEALGSLARAMANAPSNELAGGA